MVQTLSTYNVVNMAISLVALIITCVCLAYLLQINTSGKCQTKYHCTGPRPWKNYGLWATAQWVTLLLKVLLILLGM